MRKIPSYIVCTLSILMFVGCSDSNSNQPSKTVSDKEKKEIEISKIYLNEDECSSKKAFKTEEDQQKWVSSFVNKDFKIDNIDKLSTLNCFRHDSYIKKLVHSFGWGDIDSILTSFDEAININKESINAVNSIKQLKYKWASIAQDDLYLFCDPVDINTGKPGIDKSLSSQEKIDKRRDWMISREKVRNEFFIEAVAPLKQLIQKLEENSINDINLEQESENFMPYLSYAFQKSYASFDDVRAVTYSVESLGSNSSIDDVIKKYKHILNSIDANVFSKGPLSSDIGIVRIHRKIRFDNLNTLYNELISKDFKGKYIDTSKNDFEFYNNYSKFCVGESSSEAQILLEL